jgi:hypothetical protein
MRQRQHFDAWKLTSSIWALSWWLRLLNLMCANFQQLEPADGPGNTVKIRRPLRAIQ